MTEVGPSSHKVMKTPLIKKSKYEIKTTTVPLGVKIKRDLLVQLNNLMYVDHEVRDIAKFPYFKNEVDMEPKEYPR